MIMVEQTRCTIKSCFTSEPGTSGLRVAASYDHAGRARYLFDGKDVHGLGIQNGCLRKLLRQPAELYVT